jgi:hypothetical protein
MGIKPASLSGRCHLQELDSLDQASANYKHTKQFLWLNKFLLAHSFFFIMHSNKQTIAYFPC